MKKQKKEADRKEYPSIKQSIDFENHETNKKLIENLWDVVLVTSPKGRILYANNAVKRYGFSRKDVVGKMMYGFVPKKYWHTLTKYHAQLLKGKVICGETEIITKKKLVVVCEYVTSPIRRKGKTVAFQTILRDITEQKKAKEKIKASEKRLKDIVESSTDWIWEIDKNKKYIFVSKSVKQILGYIPKEIIGKTPLDFMPKDEAKRVSEIFRKIALKRKPIVDLENWNLTKQGKRICLLTNGMPMLDEKGKLMGYRGIDKDITEQKKAEDMLQERGELLRATLESTADGILVVDEQWHVTHTNARFAKMWKIPKEIIQTGDDRKLLDYVLNQLEEPQAFLSRVKQLYKTPKESFDVIIFKDGRVFERFSYPLIQEGKITGRVWDFRNVTEQKKAEKAIHKSEERYRATFENTGTAMIIIEEDTTISLANNQMEILTGYSKQEIEGKMSWTKFVYKEDLEKMKKYHNERRKPKGNAHKQYEFRFIDKNKKIKNIFLTVNIIPGTKKSLASLMDITERKQIEQEIKKRNEELEKFNKFVVGRELKMVKLKKKIKELEIMFRKKEEKK